MLWTFEERGSKNTHILRRIAVTHKHTTAMWEVVWTDPHRESVKEHRERKAIQREQREQREKSRPQPRSTSNRSSASSDNKSFGIFGPKSLKRSIVSKQAASSPTPPANTNSNQTPRQSSRISIAPSASSNSGRLSEISAIAVQLSSVNTAPEQFIDLVQSSPGSSQRGTLILPCLLLATH